MTYTSAQLRAAYSAEHMGLAPNTTTGAAIDAVALETTAGARTDISARAFVINGADQDTAVATLSYQFFTGAAPTANGLSYLVNSATNSTDLNDAYYASFNLENRYINFASNLGVVGQGATAFAATYGAMSFAQVVDAAYEKIIGATYAAAAGVDATAAKADIVGRLAYFTALANQNFATGSQVQRDMAIRAEVVGYIMGEGMKADVGTYAASMNKFSLALLNGTATYGADLTLTYPTTAATVRPVGDDGTAPGGGTGGATTTNLGSGNNIVSFGDAANIITAGDGNNTITAGNGGNTITTGNGNNTISTGTGADIITTGSGNDTINAGDGANLITSGGGLDTITTGTGADIIVMGVNLASTDTITAGAGIDILKVGGLLADVAFTSVTGVEILDLAAGANVVIGATAMTGGVRTVTNSAGGGVTLDAGGYTTPIAINGGTGADTLSGGTGADTLTGGAGVDTLNGAAGSDLYVFSDTDSDTDLVLTSVTDIIAGGFIAGADKLDFTVAGTVGNYQEVLTVAASLAAFSAAADAALNGTTQYYFGVVGADGYLAMDIDGTGITAIIKMAGVTDLAFSDIT
ncbi:MAG: rsaA [Caulobacter sp.]|nr:rsaA [Caulobacter sp.]